MFFYWGSWQRTTHARLFCLLRLSCCARCVVNFCLNKWVNFFQQMGWVDQKSSRMAKMMTPEFRTLECSQSRIGLTEEAGINKNKDIRVVSVFPPGFYFKRPPPSPLLIWPLPCCSLGCPVFAQIKVFVLLDHLWSKISDVEEISGGTENWCVECARLTFCRGLQLIEIS